VYLVYSLLMGLAAILLTPYWVVQGIRQKKYLSNLRERLGLSFPGLEKLPADRVGALWLHAVSVGEVLAGVTLAKRLKEEFPERPLVVSTTTITGQALAKERMPFADAVIYFPLDWQFCLRRALVAVDPALIIVLETEIWPNFLRVASDNNIPVLFISGRISDRSFARSQSWLSLFGFYLRPFWKDALGRAGGFWMQSERDAERVKALGAPAANVRVGGNLKYDLELPKSTPLADWLEGEIARDERRPVVVAGSVVATEEPLALIAFGVLQGEHRKALLVLAPRKPERFEAAAQFIEDSHQKWIKRSSLRVASPSGLNANGSETVIAGDVAVLLLDSIGELASLYRLADGVFVGGSLVESGGHNILEPAAFGKVPVFGESMENFAEMAERFVAAEAALQVASPEDVGVSWIELLRNPERNKKMGESARRLVEESRGATERAVTAIRAELDKGRAAD
jgi:3-deoxy-D-manno-octulosonic-acid transferase